jgi:hypothetical protein
VIRRHAINAWQTSLLKRVVRYGTLRAFCTGAAETLLEVAGICSLLGPTPLYLPAPFS